MGIINLNGQIQFWRGGGEEWVDVPVPDAAFNFVPFTIQHKVGTRTFRPKPGWDIKSHVDMTGGNRYVKKGGDNGAAGTSWETAWETIRHALQYAPDKGVIYVDSGIYGWDDGGPQDYAWPRNLSLIGVGNVIIDSYKTPSWSKTGGQTNVYETAWAYGSAAGVLDYSVIEADGFPQAYTKQTSVGDVDSNEGSWYWASNVLYVHAVGHGSPSSSVRPQRREGYAGRIEADNRKGYLENLRIYSTRIAAGNASATGGTEMYVKDCILMAKGCDFTSGASHVGNGGASVILQGCEILGGVTEVNRGIEYFVLNGVTGYLALIDCHIHDIGDPDVATQSLCFRSIQNTKLLVVGGEYDHVLDATMYMYTGTYAWILGANVHHGKYNFWVYSTACYLDNVTGTDYTTQQFNMPAAVAIYLRNFVGGFKGGDGNKMTGYDY